MGLPTANWLRPKMNWCRITACQRNDSDLSVVRGRRLFPECESLFGRTGNSIGEGRERWERPRPAGLEKFDTNTSRGPQHFTGPPRNETDITQNKKIRQCVFAVSPGKYLEHF